jgi:hypothetical protein
LNKIAGLEETEVADSRTGKVIRISTTVRIIYRKLYPEEYGTMRNARLNQVIAADFAQQSGNVLHYFRLGKDASGGIGEIRGSSSSFFVSALKSETIDVLVIQKSWLKPRYQGTREDPVELGDE